MEDQALHQVLQCPSLFRDVDIDLRARWRGRGNVHAVGQVRQQSMVFREKEQRHWSRRSHGANTL